MRCDIDNSANALVLPGPAICVHVRYTYIDALEQEGE
jgi:hypothetical protein